MAGKVDDAFEGVKIGFNGYPYYDEDNHVCPDCESDIVFDLECPGFYSRSYSKDGSMRLMVCQGCGNTDIYTCTVCEWWYSPEWNRGDYTGQPMGEPPKARVS